MLRLQDVKEKDRGSSRDRYGILEMVRMLLR